jgi:hypothetical protein
MRTGASEKIGPVESESDIETEATDPAQEEHCLAVLPRQQISSPHKRRIDRGSPPMRLDVGLQHRRSAKIERALPYLLLQAVPHRSHLLAGGLAASFLVVQEGELLTGTTADGDGVRRLASSEIEAVVKRLAPLGTSPVLNRAPSSPPSSDRCRRWDRRAP